MIIRTPRQFNAMAITCTLLAGLLLAPARAATLVTHYDATALTGVTNGQPIHPWPDESGNGNQANREAVGKEGIYTNAVIGGQPALRFFFSSSGTDNGYTSASNMGTAFGISGDAGFSIVCVMREIITNGNFTHILGLGNGVAPLKATSLEIQNFSGNVEHRFDIATGLGSDTELRDGDATPNDSWHDEDRAAISNLFNKELIITISHDHETGNTAFDTTALFVNGFSPGNGVLLGGKSLADGGSGSGPLALADGPILIAGAINLGIDAFISEIRIYSNKLTTAKRQKVEYKLSQKYGITGKFFPPSGTVFGIE